MRKTPNIIKKVEAKIWIVSAKIKKLAPQKITPQFRSRQLSLYLSEAFSPIKWFLFSWHFLKIEFSRSIWRFYVLFKFPRHRFDFLKIGVRALSKVKWFFVFSSPFSHFRSGPSFSLFYARGDFYLFRLRFSLRHFYVDQGNIFQNHLHPLTHTPYILYNPLINIHS